MKFFSFFLFIFLFASGCSVSDAVFSLGEKTNEENLNSTQEQNEEVSEPEQPEGNLAGSEKQEIKSGEEKVQEVSEPEIPQTFLINAPFTPQAPTGDWTGLYQETCEEASVLIAVKYLSGATTLSKYEANEELLKLVSWEQEYFGFFESTDTVQTQEMIEKYYGNQVKLITDVTKENIQKELFAGNVAIVPTTGRTLGNPYFTGEGPLYHMLVVVGWDERDFITHDVGTWRGKNYHYSYDVLINAIHDYNHGDIYNGTPMFLSVGKKI